MSAPGQFTDAELWVVDEAGSRLALSYAPSWLNAAAELEAAFEFAPRITVTKGMPVGAYRTTREQAKVSPTTSAQYSDHCKGRAVDITNHRRFRNIDEPRFLAILSAAGWHNVNTSGRAFPSEPWHFANQSATPLGAGTLIIRTKARRKSMTTNYVKASTGDKKGGIGSLWALAGDVGSPCPGNWIEFTRTYSSNDDIFDKGKRLAAAHGDAIYLTDAEWAQYKQLYTTPASFGNGTAVGPLAVELKGTATPA